MPTAVRLIAAAALTLCAASAFAQNAPGQEAAPAPEKGVTAQAACIGEDDHYFAKGKQPMFAIALENKCEQRMTCKVFVYITSAKGVSQGRGILTMAAKSKGAAAKQIYIMKSKMSGGSSQSTRECRAL